MTEKRCICLQLEEYIADNMIELCEKRGNQQIPAGADDRNCPVFTGKNYGKRKSAIFAYA